jgi:NAD-dependent dihydropyrimidine dehydrogenase PreA subunit
MFDSYTENSLAYDPAECIGCKKCWEVCPHGIFFADGKKAGIIRQTECIECGACALNCPTGAIFVYAGVGCASAMILAAVTGRKEACCG